MWDWHVTDNRVRAHQIAYDVERLRLNISLSEQVLSLLKAALRLDLYARQVKQSQMAIADMRPYITAIEAQGEAGFVRLVNVRRARISLSAYDVSRYGSLEGVVKHIASNTTEREEQPPFYETIITVPDPVFPKIDLTPDIVPGMTVVVDIISGKRTVLDYIRSPIDRAARVAFREN